MFSATVKIATPETPSACKRERADDGGQWGMRSDANSTACNAKELAARDESEICECEVSLDSRRLQVQIKVNTSIARPCVSLVTLLTRSFALVYDVIYANCPNLNSLEPTCRSSGRASSGVASGETEAQIA